MYNACENTEDFGITDGEITDEEVFRKKVYDITGIRDDWAKWD